MSGPMNEASRPAGTDRPDEVNRTHRQSTAPPRRPARDARRRALLVAMGLLLAEEVAA